MVSPEDVVTAYRLFLDREPENQAVVAEHSAAPDLRALSKSFRGSEEFRAGQVVQLPDALDLAPPLPIEVEVNQELLGKMWARVVQTWSRLGVSDPYWSVLSCEEFKGPNFEKNSQRFHSTGEREVKRMAAWLERNGIPNLCHRLTCCEFGCGTGRVTRWLASAFAQVVACDVSQAHIDLARGYLDRLGIANVHFERIHSPDTPAFERVDFVFSFLVLQHNPPPLMAVMLTRMFQILKPGGVAFFQLPTYWANYSFRAVKYLGTVPPYEFEMHVLPQRYVFAIAAAQNCEILEVEPDPFVGSPRSISMTFLVRKRTV